MDVVVEYVRLGLRFDRLEPGFVDSFTGDPALRRAVEAEPQPQPADLAARARELAAELPSAGLPPDRVEFLAAHLAALECGARRLAGEPVGFVDEVAAYFQVRPELGDQEAYAAAHAELDRLLPGEGDLASRYAEHGRRDECPPQRLEEAVRALSSRLRDVVRAEFPLAEHEVVDYQIVTDKPWGGFNYYLGNYRSTVAINADLPARMAHLPALVAHESYPGHHTEQCRKERLLVEGRQLAEQTIFLVNTPSCLMAEGLADLGLRVAVGDGWGGWAQETYEELGLRVDGDLAERVARAFEPLDAVRQDAALLLHDRHRPEEEVVAYLQRWALMPPERARQALRFLAHPLWRAYISTYVEGFRLLSAWLDAAPSGQGPARRFARLLDEPLTPRAVAAELAPATA